MSATCSFWSQDILGVYIIYRSNMLLSEKMSNMDEKID
jgi:hypothetical protein